MMSLDRLIGLFGLLFLIAIAARTYLVYRRNGSLPIKFGASDQAHDFLHHVLAAIVVLQGLNIVVFRLSSLENVEAGSSFAEFYGYLCPIEFLQIPAIKLAGVVIAYSGLGFSILAQHQMGGEWRVGIDSSGAASLVREGLYARARHPIYLGFMMICLGIFLAVPNALSLLCAGLAIVVLSVLARLEEEYLLSRHGQSYRDYLANTRRWI